MDALGLNSTFVSAELDASHAPKVDAVETSELEGPEDFTVNMTYWMTADLPLSQIKSRKERTSKPKLQGVRGDAEHVVSGLYDTTEEGDKAIIEETTRDRAATDEGFDSASPTRRASRTADSFSDDRAPSEASMENDEKVRSYLSALPDSDGPAAFSTTPLKVGRGNLLQVPTPVTAKARSLQATVEDYDTPRKPTQETVIHHIQEPTIMTEIAAEDVLRDQIAKLQSRLEQQELTSKTRITELETILSFTRSELDTMRTENYKQREQIAKLSGGDEGSRQGHAAETANLEAKLREKDKELGTRLREFGEELHLQNLAKLQNQREDFEQQLAVAEEAKRTLEERNLQKENALERLQSEIDQLRHAKEQELLHVKETHSQEFRQHQQSTAAERDAINEKLSGLQTRAEMLQAELAKATVEAQSAREEAERAHGEAHSARAESRATMSWQSSSQSTAGANTTLVLELESRLDSLQSQLDSAHAGLNARDQQIIRHIEEQDDLEQRLGTAQGRVEGLETTVSALRQQLTDAHRDSSKARTDAERFEQEAEDANERLDDAKKEAERRIADVERKLFRLKELKMEAEDRYQGLQAEHKTRFEDHDEKLEEVRLKAEEAVRKVGLMLENERSEKRKLAKDLKTRTAELDQLRSEMAGQQAEDEESEQETSTVSAQPDSKEMELENLRTLLRQQAAETKAIKVETMSLRKKTQTSNSLETTVEALRQENADLKSLLHDQRADFEAVNTAMDDRLAGMLSKVLKERSRNVASKRDDQWAESVGKLKSERELMGKVLMREWGRQECGVREEKEGAQEGQTYRYKYVKRT
jgi:chromosome segregation ATPase